jgi:hypothetical protein
MDEVDDSSGVLVTAKGLLMYLQRDDVHGLVERCAERFRHGALVFDVVPRWLAERSRRGQLKTKTGYEPPPWLWGFDGGEERRLRQLPSIIELRALRLPRGRGVAHAWLLPLASRTPLERLLPSVLLARFA